MTDRITPTQLTTTITATVVLIIAFVLPVSTTGFTDSGEMVLEVGFTNSDDVVATGTTAMLINYLHTACKE